MADATRYQVKQCVWICMEVSYLFLGTDLSAPDIGIGGKASIFSTWKLIMTNSKVVGTDGYVMLALK